MLCCLQRCQWVLKLPMLVASHGWEGRSACRACGHVHWACLYAQNICIKTVRCRRLDASEFEITAVLFKGLTVGVTCSAMLLTKVVTPMDVLGPDLKVQFWPSC